MLCEALRPASVLAKALATLDRICDGRLDVGIGAGWYEPEYEAIGMAMPPPGERLARLREAIEVVHGPARRRPVHVRRAATTARSTRATTRRRVQQPRPPVFVGGKGDRLLATVVAEVADGWNTCWVWTPDAYRERLEVLDARVRDGGPRSRDGLTRRSGSTRCAARTSATSTRRFERLRAATPPGVLDGVTLDEWRVGRLVGTVEQVREQAAGWAEPRGRDR